MLANQHSQSNRTAPANPDGLRSGLVGRHPSHGIRERSTPQRRAYNIAQGGQVDGVAALRSCRVRSRMCRPAELCCGVPDASGFRRAAIERPSAGTGTGTGTGGERNRFDQAVVESAVEHDRSHSERDQQSTGPKMLRARMRNRRRSWRADQLGSPRGGRTRTPPSTRRSPPGSASVNTRL